VPDLKARLPGRGVWIGLDRNCVAEAARKNAFSRSLKRQVTPPADLAGDVSARLKEAALGRLGLARKAGAVAAGFAKVEGLLERDRLAAVLIAWDAAEDGRRKMEQVLRRNGKAASVPVIRLFDSAELGLATGRANVIHAAVLQGPAGKSFLDAADRFRRYEGVGTDEPQGAVGCGKKLDE
jgi:ribosomal protein L7Ae-like RNA K-turn-binding protein